MAQADSNNSTPAPAAESPVYLPTDTTPEQLFRAIGKLRKDARDEIDQLIRFLNETENHMELEPNGDELDTSYPESGPRGGTSGEDDEGSDANEDDDTAEPALAALTGKPIKPHGRSAAGATSCLTGPKPA